MAAGKTHGRKKAKYERQRAITQRNKVRRATKRAKDLAYWIMRGKKKNGKKIRTEEERKAQKIKRAELRKSRRMEARSNWNAVQSHVRYTGHNKSRRPRPPTVRHEEED
jgi:hypothetical protein